MYPNLKFNHILFKVGREVIHESRLFLLAEEGKANARPFLAVNGRVGSVHAG